MRCAEVQNLSSENYGGTVPGASSDPHSQSKDQIVPAQPGCFGGGLYEGTGHFVVIDCSVLRRCF